MMVRGQSLTRADIDHLAFVLGQLDDAFGHVEVQRPAPLPGRQKHFEGVAQGD